MRTLRDHFIGYRQTNQASPDPWRTPAWAADRRSVRRVVCKAPAFVRASQRRRTGVEIANLSTHGCAVKGAETHMVGARCWLILPTLESWDANVAWSSGALFGLDFARPLHRAVAELILRRTNGRLPWTVFS